MKEAIRRLLFLFLRNEMIAEEGTLKFRFLQWLYGKGEPEFDVIWPDDDYPAHSGGKNEHIQ